MNWKSLSEGIKTEEGIIFYNFNISYTNYEIL